MGKFAPQRSIVIQPAAPMVALRAFSFPASQDDERFDPRTAAMLRLAEDVVKHWRETGASVADMTGQVVPDLIESMTAAIRADEAARLVIEKADG